MKLTTFSKIQCMKIPLGEIIFDKIRDSNITSGSQGI